MILVDSIKFKTILLDTLLKKEVSIDIANDVVESLIQTSLRGVDSHGINLFPHYYSELELNRINIKPQIKINQTGQSTATLFADNSFGYHSGNIAIRKCIEMAKNTGLGAVSVSNSTHFGAAAYFTFQISNVDMIGLAFTNTEALVNAFNSKDSFFGTNPFCFSAPMENEEPFCLDMATSTVAWNKIKNHRRQNIPLLPGWALDKEGKETLNPHNAASLTAIGGYKGFGLGMIIEILCSGLTAGPLSKDIAPLYDLSIPDQRNISHFFIAIDIKRFIDISLFKQYMSSMTLRIRSLSKNSDESIFIAGDKEKISFKNRKINGIPIDKDKFNEFLTISEAFKLAVI